MAPRVKRNTSRKVKRNYNRFAGRKQAYKKRGVQQKFALQKPRASTVRQLANIAECKKFQGVTLYPEPTKIGIQQVYLSTTASATFLPIQSFYYMRSKQDWNGLSAVEGKDIFSRYLQMKLEVKYPSTHFGPEGGTRPLEVIYGFVTPLNLTDRTTPKEDEVMEAEIQKHIIDQVAEDFDSANDTMEFKQRRRRGYNIVGRFKVKPNNNGLVPSPWRSDQAPGQIGTTIGDRDVPPLRRNINFKMMKKVRYHRSHQGDPVDPIEPIIYPRSAYLPFVLLYNPDHANYSVNDYDPSDNLQVKQIKVRHNDCHWFNDF